MRLDEVVFWIISVLLAVAAVLSVAESFGFVPEFVLRWLNRNKLTQTIAVLEEMGLDIDRLKRRNAAAVLVEHFHIDELPKRVNAQLCSLTLNKPVGVGSTEVVQTKSYIDLMSGTTDPGIAEMFARYLETFWRKQIETSHAEPHIKFASSLFSMGSNDQS